MARLKIITPPRWVTHGESDHTTRPLPAWRAFLGGAAYVNPVHTALQRIQRVWFGPTQPHPVAIEVGGDYLTIHFRKEESLTVPTAQIEELVLDQYHVSSYQLLASPSEQDYTKWQLRTTGGERYVFYTPDREAYASWAVTILRRNWSARHSVRQIGHASDETTSADRRYVSYMRYRVGPLEYDGSDTMTVGVGAKTRPTKVYLPQPRNHLGPEVEIGTERIHFLLAELPTPFEPPRRPGALRDGAYQETPFVAGAIELTPRHIIVRLDDHPVRLYAYTELTDLCIGRVNIFRDCEQSEYRYESYSYAEIAFSIPGCSFRYFVEDTHYRITVLSVGVEFLTGFESVAAPEYKREDIVHEPRYENRSCDAKRILFPGHRKA